MGNQYILGDTCRSVWLVEPCLEVLYTDQLGMGISISAHFIFAAKRKVAMEKGNIAVVLYPLSLPILRVFGLVLNLSFVID